MLRQELWPLVLQGKKRITIRKRAHVHPGEEVFIHAGGKIVGKATVRNVYKKKMKEIGEEEAKKEGIPLDKLLLLLRNVYGPDPEQWLTVIEFDLTKVYDPPIDPERLHYGDLTPVEVAKKALELGIVEKQDREIVEKIAKYGSLRRVAFELGGLWKRKIIRRILRKYRKKLEEITP